MPHYGTLRESKLQQDPDDLRGAEVYGVNDEELGTVDDVIFDHSSGDIRYVVVETGGLFSKKSFLVPANRVFPYGNHDDKFYAELDKERIQMLPEYDVKALKSESNWSAYEKHYENQWKDGALMYNTSTGRMITPSPEEIPRARAGSGNSPSDVSGRERAADARFDDSRIPASDKSIGERAKDKMRDVKDDVIRRTPRPGEREGDVVAHREGLDRPGLYRGDAVPEAEKRSDMNEPLNASYGPRWNRFQSRLRERRDDVVAECPLCGRQRKVA